MWKRLFNLAVHIFNVTEDVRKLKETSKQQGQQINRLAAAQAHQRYEHQIERERDARERERENYERERQYQERERVLLERQYELERMLHDRQLELLELENRQLRERLEKSERLSLPPAPADNKDRREMR